MYNLPKVLVCAPTSDKKDYCFADWITNVRNFSYPKDRYDIFISDNSITYDYCRKLKEQQDIIVHRVNNRDKKTLIRSMTESQQACRRYALEKDYDFILNLESDVFPRKNIILDLLTMRRPVAAATYHIFSGAKSHLMIQLMQKGDGHVHFMLTRNIGKDQVQWLDGRKKQVYSAGLGCVLIRKQVLEEINFRYVKGEEQHADSFFAYDCLNMGIPIWVDTSIICEHRNQSWGVYKLDYN